MFALSLVLLAFAVVAALMGNGGATTVVALVALVASAESMISYWRSHPDHQG